ncbi:MAG: ABC transporter ATP-binding protein [Hyphomicrobiales bacterium]|nr:MAG: ABC transporter ATP-binding protein [Hyphomicrobiales bacterium]
MKPIIRMHAIHKNFGGVQALKNVNLDIHGGEVVALLGHNGAGKSVLVQILSGVFLPTSGSIEVEGRSARFSSPRDARAAHIETIYQTLALAENLDATANFFLGREIKNRFGFLDNRAMRSIAQENICKLNANFELTRSPVRNLSGGQRQAIAIARAVYFKARILVMDEPTAALGPHETEQVVMTINNLRDHGLGILLVSHDLNDVFRLADRVVVLKGGQVVGSGDCANLSMDDVLHMIVAGTPVFTQTSQTPA